MFSANEISKFHQIPSYRYKEYWFPVLNALLICILGSFPYLYGYYIAGEDKVFMGMVGRGTHASFGYLMFQRQAMEGNFGLRNQCTPEKLPSSYFNIEWWLMGRLAYWSGLSLIQIHHLDRIFSVFLLLIIGYYFLCVVLETLPLRIFTFLLIIYGSGMGWMIWVINRILNTAYPYTWDIQGVQVFGYLINKPHFIRAFAVATLMYAYLIRGYQTRKFKYFLLSGIAGLIHLVIRPHYGLETLIIYFFLPIIYFYITEKYDYNLYLYSFVAGIIHFPAFVYYGWFALEDPLGMRGWSIKADYLGKPGFLIEYAIGIGWTFILVLLLIPYILKRAKENLNYFMTFAWLFITWFICNLYPYWKLGQEAGFHVFYVGSPVLAITTVSDWIKEKLSVKEKFFGLRNRWPHVGLCTLLMFFSLPTTVYVYANMFTSLKNGHPVWAYTLSKDAYDALLWLNENAQKDAIVLATDKTSQFIFAFTNCRTVTGNFTLTINFFQKDTEVRRFFSEIDCESFQRRLIEKYKVDFVIFGPYEKQLSNGLVPFVLKELVPVFVKGDTEVYKVNR